MRWWATLRRNHQNAGPSGAELKLSASYQNLFTGNATREEAEVVLADLAADSGFFAITDPSQHAALPFQEGKRALFGRIWANMRMSNQERISLEEAVREEQAARENDVGDY